MCVFEVGHFPFLPNISFHFKDRPVAAPFSRCQNLVPVPLVPLNQIDLCVARLYPLPFTPLCMCEEGGAEAQKRYLANSRGGGHGWGPLVEN